jgi:uncharacterized membrane-anchored protein
LTKKETVPLERPIRNRLRLLGVTAIVLAQLLVLSAQIGRSEAILSSGQTIYLELLPRDPRSLLQGDYVELRYAIAEPPASLPEFNALREGAKIAVVLGRSPSGASEFKRLYAGNEPLSPGEAVMNGKWRGSRIEYGIETYFVPEGTGTETQLTAKYAEIRLARDGNAILVALLPALPAPTGEND